MDRFLEAAGRVKPLSRCELGSNSLKQCLTLVDLVAYGVGCSVGAGVYSLVGVGAQIAGPSISLSFLVSGIACIFTSLTYSEFAARVPVTGSAYTFVYITFGELAAWLIGWNLTLGYGISAAGIARSWASYAHLFLQHLGLHLPRWLVQAEVLGVSCSILASFLIICCTVILLAGVHESAKFNAFVTLLNISVLLFVVAFGSTEVDATNWEHFMPAGFHGVMTGAGVVFFAYLGFDMVACLAEEVHEPQRTLPKGIIGSLLISMTIYVGVSLVVTGMAPVDILVFTFVNAGVLLLRMRPSLSGAGVVHRVLLFVISCFALSLSFVFDLPWTMQGIFAAMVIASYVFIHRLGKFGDLTTSFQCPLVPLVPCMGILANVYMVASIPGEGWIGVFIWLGAGLIVYLCYGIRHSLLSDPAILHPLI
ncbi:hypothetical protein JG687_00001176 [Phytophthora cactorum]|uniref:Cationic amino acid transporter C-terminal domain-containing protein n=1 Tax=Phytophthora cactorum TaxID=29920 RepID=A0A8T1V0J3_9STRA|nr:hypothetical protein JG687_00001176 [Phytophthora cactorum]